MGRAIHGAGVVACVCLLLGLATRLATAACLVCFAYIFALDVSLYSNHCVLILHVLVLAQFVRWGNWGSLDRLITERRTERTTPTFVPHWHLVAMQLLTVAPYAFGAVAKLNPDWSVRAQPLRLYYEKRVEITNFDSLPLVASWLRLAFDASMPALLMWESTRVSVALPACVMFHLNQKILFRVGGFPTLMVAALCLFLPPHGPDRICRLLSNRVRPASAPKLKTTRSMMPEDCGLLDNTLRDLGLTDLSADEIVTSSGHQQAKPGTGHRRVPSSVSVHFSNHSNTAATNSAGGNWAVENEGSILEDFTREAPADAQQQQQQQASVPAPLPPADGRPAKHPTRITKLLWAAFVLFHVLWPLRRFALYRGNVSWHEAGHLGSWRTGVRTKRGWSYLIAEGADGKLHEFAPALDTFILKAQRSKLIGWPHSLLQYAARMRDIFEAAGMPVHSIRAHSCISVNGHDARELFNPEVNLLDHVGRYELVGTSGVGSLLHDWGVAPKCALGGGYRGNLSLRRRMLKTLSRVYSAASVREALPPAASTSYEGDDNEAYGFQVVHVDTNGAQQLAYLWKPGRRSGSTSFGHSPGPTHRGLFAARHRHVDMDDSNDDDDYVEVSG